MITPPWARGGSGGRQHGGPLHFRTVTRCIATAPGRTGRTAGTPQRLRPVPIGARHAQLQPRRRGADPRVSAQRRPCGSSPSVAPGAVS